MKNKRKFGWNEFWKVFVAASSFIGMVFSILSYVH